MDANLLVTIANCLFRPFDARTLGRLAQTCRAMSTYLKDLQGFPNSVANPQWPSYEGSVSHFKIEHPRIRVFNPIYLIGWMDEYKCSVTPPWVSILTKRSFDKPNTSRRSVKTPAISKRHVLQTMERQRHAASFKSKR